MRYYNNMTRRKEGLTDPVFTLFVAVTRQAVKDLHSPRLSGGHKATATTFLSDNLDIFQRAGIPVEKIEGLVMR